MAVSKVRQKKHRHYWNYPHSIWQGRKDSEVCVARYCGCGAAQVAFASAWQPIFPDVRDAVAASLKSRKLDGR